MHTYTLNLLVTYSLGHYLGKKSCFDTNSTNLYYRRNIATKFHCNPSKVYCRRGITLKGSGVILPRQTGEVPLMK